jgi:hypothetical protein
VLHGEDGREESSLALVLIAVDDDKALSDDGRGKQVQQVGFGEIVLISLEQLCQCVFASDDYPFTVQDAKVTEHGGAFELGLPENVSDKLWKWVG